MNDTTTISIPTFTPRAALRPRVVPVHATTIPGRVRQPPGIHRTLIPKPLFRPYPASKPTGTDIGTDIFSDPPGSPLMPLAQDFESGSASQVQINLIPRPSLDLGITKIWDEKVVASYRKIAREAVNIELETGLKLSAQKVEALGKARLRVENAIPEFKDHVNHWGADLLLQDQLKSKKDTLAAAKRRKKERN